MRIGENTWVSGRLALPVDVTTVLGNLIDNAIDAARTGADDTKIVEVELLQDGSTLHITVADSGDGVAPDFVEHVFTEGESTKPQSGIPGAAGSVWRCPARSAVRWAETCDCRARGTPMRSCVVQSSSPGCRV